MFLLYCDESGQSKSRHFVLSGVAAFERRPYWLSNVLDQIQLKFLPNETGSIEFHATAIRAGKDPPWNAMDIQDRRLLLDAIYEAIAEAQIDLFASVISRDWLRPDVDEYSYAFESLLNRFDRFLRSKYKDEGEAQRGIIIIAESQYSLRIETLAKQIQKVGTRWGEAYNLCEIPLFTPAANSRMLQVADFCANAIYGKYEGGYSRQFDRISPKFFEFDGVVHGLAHYSKNFDTCMCPGCITRRISGARLETPSGQQGPLL